MIESPLLKRPRRGEDQEKQKPRRLLLRNILNTVFMIGAVVGVVIYFKHDEYLGTVVILVAMMIKMSECVFRFMK